MSTSTGELNSSVLNGMNMIDTIKSTGAEKAFFNSWYQSQISCNSSKLSNFRINRMISACSNLHSYLTSGIQLFLGAYFIADGKFTLGTMALFSSVLGNMRNSMSSVLSSINTMQTMRTNIERVNDITERPVRPEIHLEDGVQYDKLEGHIEVSHLNYRYNKGDRLAIEDVSLEVKPGQMIAIVGATGCGKSTLLKLMADLYEPESGEILYAGRHRSEIPDTVFHSSVATVDQEAVVFEDSIYANLRMWDKTVEDYEIYLAARDAQIHNRIMRDKEGYGAKIRENGSNFSGGELQRLELARALF
jgi:ABC-type bacteriocin/lantibiotic exporter with double-glycine peptidase domain